MPGKGILIFDCDDVIAAIGKSMCDMCSRMSGRECKTDDWIRYNYFTDLGITPADFLAGIVSYKILENAPVFDGAIEAIKEAQLAGYDIAVVTARGFHPKGEEVTKRWFKSLGIDLDYLYVVGPSQSKLDAIRELCAKGAIGYVDDHHLHLETIKSAELDLALFLMDQPWNRKCTDFKRVYSIDEFISGVRSAVMA